jgi:hypothetical protein
MSRLSTYRAVDMAEATPRLICGTRIGVQFHMAYTELLCPACIIADREHSRRRAPSQPRNTVVEHIQRCRCGAWLRDGQPCVVCAVLNAGAA